MAFSAEGQHKVVITSNLTTNTGDYVLAVGLAEALKSTLYLEDPASTFDSSTAGSSSAAELPTALTMLSVYPDLSRPFVNDQISEIVFVVDRSGSMSGTYIKVAAETLAM